MLEKNINIEMKKQVYDKKDNTKIIQAVIKEAQQDFREYPYEWTTYEAEA